MPSPVIAKPRASFLPCASLVLAGCLAALVPAAAQFPTANPSYQTGFPKALPNADGVRSSSVTLADLDGNAQTLEIVVGTTAGEVVAFDSLGNLMWTFDPVAEGVSAMPMPIEGKPAVGDVDGDGSPEVVVGAGSTFAPTNDGGLYVISHTGSLQCSFTTEARGGDGSPDGVFSSPAIGDLDGNDGGKLEIAFGSWDFIFYVLQHDCTEWWKTFVPMEITDVTDENRHRMTTDTIWSSPAMADLDGDGVPEVIVGVDSNFKEPPLNVADGGRLHVFRNDGGAFPGFPIQIDEVIWSSPVVGDIDGDGQPDIVVGTGWCWDKTECAPLGNTHDVSEQIYAFDAQGQPLTGWPFVLSSEEYAFSSAALADVDGNGVLDVVINTSYKRAVGQNPLTDPDLNGWSYVINGDGTVQTGWPKRPRVPGNCEGFTVSLDTTSSPVVADLDDDGNMEVIRASNWDVVIFDHEGNQLTRDSCSGGFKTTTNGPVNSAPAVGDLDGDGDLELVAAGHSGAGAIYAWDFSGAASEQALPWPQFRRGPLNQANVPSDGIFADGFESGDTTKWVP